MVSKKDFNSAELETMRTSSSPTTVITANGEVQTNKEATEYVMQLDLFVKVMLLEEIPSVFYLGKLCEDHGFFIPLDQQSKTTSHQKWQKELIAKKTNYVPFVVPGLSASSSSSTPSPTSPSSSSQDSVSHPHSNQPRQWPQMRRQVPSVLCFLWF